MIYRRDYTKEEIVKMVKAGEITLAGCDSGKKDTSTYGIISVFENGRYVVKCSGGKQLMKGLAEKPLKYSNQVFFTDEADALDNGFRPCGACFKNTLYAEWKSAPDKEVWKQKRLAALKKG